MRSLPAMPRKLRKWEIAIHLLASMVVWSNQQCLRQGFGFVWGFRTGRYPFHPSSLTALYTEIDISTQDGRLRQSQSTCVLPLKLTEKPPRLTIEPGTVVAEYPEPIKALKHQNADSQPQRRLAADAFATNAALSSCGASGRWEEAGV